MADNVFIEEHDMPLVRFEPALRRAIDAWNHASKTNEPEAWLVAADACEEGGYPGSARSARFHAARVACDTGAEKRQTGGTP